MREVTIRIRFLRPSLGAVKAPQGRGEFLLMRDSQKRVMFMPSWHKANMIFAAQLANVHQDEVTKILWDVTIDVVVRKGSWYRRFYKGHNGKDRFVVHEAIMPGTVAGINCVVPSAITDDDLFRLVGLAGKYKGLSHAKPGEFGYFEVESIRPRRSAAEEVKRQEPETLSSSPALAVVGLDRGVLPQPAVDQYSSPPQP